jgi:hypothetical protein
MDPHAEVQVLTHMPGGEPSHVYNCLLQIDPEGPGKEDEGVDG